MFVASQLDYHGLYSGYTNKNHATNLRLLDHTSKSNCFTWLAGKHWFNARKMDAEFLSPAACVKNGPTSLTATTERWVTPSIVMHTRPTGFVLTGLPYDDTTEQGMGKVLLATTLRLHLE